MRNLILSIFTATAATAGAAGDGTLRISGTLEGLGDSIAVMHYNQSSTESKSTTSKYKAQPGGKFDITLNITEVSNIYIYDPAKKNRIMRTGDMSLPAIPGEQIVVSGQTDDYIVSGTEFYRQYEATRQLRRPFDERIRAVAEKCMDMQKNKVQSDSVSAYYVRETKAVRDDMTQAIFAYITQHTDEEATVMLALAMSDDNAAKGIAMLSDNVRSGRMKPYIEGIERQRLARQERKKNQEKIKEGNAAPDFTLTKLDGTQLTLSSLRGKYVVLDFWGSWCGWCIKGMPKMKEYYAKYNGKLEILGIDCRDTDEKWRAAVKTHSLPWLHVRNEDNQKQDVSQLYGISGYPTKILISPEGNILKVIIGESPEFYQYLDQLFK